MDSIIHNRKCRNCYINSFLGLKDRKFKRNCPKCGKEIIHNKKWSRDDADRRGRLCRSCSKKGIPRNFSYDNLPEKSKLGMSKTWFKPGDRPHNADFRKGKTLIEIYGKNKAKSILAKYSERINSQESNQKRSESCRKSKCGVCNKGRRCTAENRKKFRLLLIDRLKSTNRKFHPGYNKSSCEFFDILMKETGTHIQHALNGGEYYIDGLGYWLDGYDSINNIAYEYDEKYINYDIYGKYKEKDLIKQKEVISVLKCRFIRIRMTDVAKIRYRKFVGWKENLSEYIHSISYDILGR